MALKNYSKGGSFTIGTPVPILTMSGTSFISIGMVLHNKNTVNASVQVVLNDGSQLVQIIDEVLLPKESYFYDIKMVVSDGSSIEVTTDQPELHVSISGDEE